MALPLSGLMMCLSTASPTSGACVCLCVCVCVCVRVTAFYKNPNPSIRAREGAHECTALPPIWPVPSDG
jgi:hypothetical protein